jgi:hypothetical protein
MRRLAMKALFTLLSLWRGERVRTDWERNAIVISTAVTLGLVALYFVGKATTRW